MGWLIYIGAVFAFWFIVWLVFLLRHPQPIIERPRRVRLRVKSRRKWRIIPFIGIGL